MSEQAILIRKQKVLDLIGSLKQSESGRSAIFSDDELMVTLAVEDWREMDLSRTITVTIEPGDTLNDE
jgi:hypothetical protein